MRLSPLQAGAGAILFEKGNFTMKIVLYFNKTEGCFCYTNKKNYDSYVQDARRIHILRDVKTIADVQEFIDGECRRYPDASPDDYIVIM